MRARRIIGTTTMIAGLVAFLVGVLHFVMTAHLDHFISEQLDESAKARILPVFHINHAGSGVFLIILGAVLVLTGYAGLLRGKTWGALMAFVIGAGLAGLAITLWATVPEQFLTALPFRVALISLMGVGLATALPPLFFWSQFQEA